ncbi:MAG: cinnamoyl ester hydrolase [Microbacteriaceae bacterium]|jgi:DNA-binding HxlR family transcriptional regulator|nr:cinnamoyl ester hydrolase [Microbacteriaceae bacterium]
MSDSPLSRCSTQALKILADYWVLRIIDEIHGAGDLRFSALQRALGGASPATLSNRLRCLEDEGLIRRNEGTEGKTSVSYSLSDRGQKVLPVIHAINDFAETAQ